MIKINFNNIKFKKKDLLNHYSKKMGIDLNYFFKNSLWYSINQITTIVFGILLMVFLTRFTSKEVFGNYNFIISIITMLSIISMPGFKVSLLKSVSKDEDGMYSETFKLSLIWSLTCVPLLIMIGLYYFYFDNPIIGIGLFVASIFFPLLYAPTNWGPFLEGKKRFDLSAKYNIILTFTRTFTIIIATLAGNGNIIPILIAFLITNSILNIVFHFKTKKFITNNKVEKNWKKNGYKLTFVEFTLFIYNYADKIIIGAVLGSVQLAIYVIATNVIYQIITSTGQILRVIYPKIFKMNAELIIHSLKRFVPKFILAIAGLSLIIILILPILIPLLFSENYIESVFYAQIFAIVIPLNLLTSITNPVLIALNKEDILFRFRIIGIIILLFLYIILIPFIGLLGAIISSIIYYAFLILLQFWYIFKKTEIQ